MSVSRQTMRKAKTARWGRVNFPSGKLWVARAILPETIKTEVAKQSLVLGNKTSQANLDWFVIMYGLTTKH